ncbi:BfmA/BtgA family mobilization protein [Ulvibacterium marinum]|uniref:BfmA/BtgA family mobilization protein n=1 Tax=Ulvibacterium marinum TaxID=2419782 RepID=UPI0024941AB2|nr:BfmA/BtgA family mobilization protein [Ulvibacterium marinum]
MEKKQKNKYDYSAISIKADVAVSFRRYSKQFSKSNSEVLRRMMVFLQWNGLNPFDNTIEKIVSAIEMNRKQIEYLISIIKNIEKTQTKPTYEMVKILFEAHCKNKEATRKEKLFIPKPKIREVEEKVPKIFHERKQQEFKDYKMDCQKLLEKIELVEPTFGKPYLKVDLSQGEYEKLRRQLDKD